MADSGKLWTSVKLCISYFETKAGKKRDVPFDWAADSSELKIADETEKKMTVAKVRSDCGADLTIRFSQSGIGISRESITSWSGIVVTEDAVRVKNGAQWIIVSADGQITKEDDQEISIILPDGGMVHDNPARRTCVSHCGEVTVIEKK